MRLNMLARARCPLSHRLSTRLPSGRRRRDDSRYFDTDQVAIRAKWRIDGDLLDYASNASLVMNV
jgi:hypothetical protein